VGWPGEIQSHRNFDQGVYVREGNPERSQDGRRFVRIRGTVSARAGACPLVTFNADGVPVHATGVTKFHPDCGVLLDGGFVEVTGETLGDGGILARKVKARPPFLAPAGLN
jgi:hypothetical protein